MRMFVLCLWEHVSTSMCVQVCVLCVCMYCQCMCMVCVSVCRVIYIVHQSIITGVSPLCLASFAPRTRYDNLCT